MFKKAFIALMLFGCFASPSYARTKVCELAKPCHKVTLVRVVTGPFRAALDIVIVGTDTAEYVSGKIYQGFAELDAVVDSAVEVRVSCAQTNSTCAKAAKKAAKKSKKNNHDHDADDK